MFVKDYVQNMRECLELVTLAHDELVEAEKLMAELKAAIGSGPKSDVPVLGLLVDFRTKMITRKRLDARSIESRLRMAKRQAERAFDTGIALVLNDEAELVPGDLAHLKTTMETELSYGTWLMEVKECDQAKLVSAVETMEAALIAEEEVPEHVVATIGAGRVGGGFGFANWFQALNPEYRLENGHAVLARAFGPKAVFHAGFSNDPGTQQMVWMKVGRRWDWLSGQDSFKSAGQQLLKIGQERVGRILIQSAHLGPTAVALRLAAHGGADLAGEMREVLGVEPFCGGTFDDRLEVLLAGHGASIWCATTMGEDLVTGSEDGTIKIWSKTGECTRTLEHPGWVACLATLSGTNLLASGGMDGTLVIRDLSVEEGQEGHEITLREHMEAVNALLFVNETTIVSVGGWGEMFVTVKSSATGEWMRKAQLEGHVRNVCAIASLGSGRIVTGGNGCDLLVHHVQLESLVKTLKGHTDAISSITLLKNGQIMSTSWDSTVRIWPFDLRGDAEVVLSTKHPAIVAAELDDGNIVVGDVEGLIHLWSPPSEESASWTVIGKMPVYTRSLNAIVSLPGSRFLSVGEDSQIGSVWDVSRLCLKGGTRSKPHTSDIISVTVTDSGQVVTGGYGGEVVVWKPMSCGDPGEVSRIFPGDGDPVPQLASVKDGFAWWVFDNKRISMWRDDKFAGAFLDVKPPLYALEGIDEGTGLLGLDGSGIKVWSVSGLSTAMRVKLEWGMCMDVIDDERVLVSGGGGVVSIVSHHVGAIDSQEILSSALNKSATYVGENWAVVVSNKQEMLMVNMVTGSKSKLADGVLKTYTALGPDSILIKRASGVVEVWDWMKKQQLSVLGGLDGREFSTFTWNKERRLAVFCLKKERGWLAYAL